jgi:GNAT superfamily N-acetyltransferase
MTASADLVDLPSAPAGAKVTLRVATAADVDRIVRLAADIPASPPAEVAAVSCAVRDGHAVVAVEDGGLVGACWASALAADVLAGGGLLVIAGRRGVGIGRWLVDYFHVTCPPRFALTLVCDSDLDGRAGEPVAARFWYRAGYQLLEATGPTRVFACTRHR